MRRISRILVGTFLLGCLATFLLFQFNQEVLIFKPAATPLESSFLPNPVQVIRSKEVTLKGWEVKKFHKLVNHSACHAMIYFGHGDEEVSTLIKSLFTSELRIPQLYMNYRGFGDSTGKPEHDAIISDSIAIYDDFRARIQTQFPAIKPLRICAMGKHLGAYFAMLLATKRPVKRLLLLGPFSSLPALAELTMPYLSFNYGVAQLYDLLPVAKTLPLSTKSMIIYSSTDVVVPAQTTKTLINNWPLINPVQVVQFDVGKMDFANKLFVNISNSFLTEELVEDFAE